MKIEYKINNVLQFIIEYNGDASLNCEFFRDGSLGYSDTHIEEGIKQYHLTDEFDDTEISNRVVVEDLIHFRKIIKDGNGKRRLEYKFNRDGSLIEE